MEAQAPKSTQPGGQPKSGNNPLAPAAPSPPATPPVKAPFAGAAPLVGPIGDVIRGAGGGADDAAVWLLGRGAATGGHQGGSGLSPPPSLMDLPMSTMSISHAKVAERAKAVTRTAIALDASSHVRCCL